MVFLKQQFMTVLIFYSILLGERMTYSLPLRADNGDVLRLIGFYQGTKEHPGY